MCLSYVLFRLRSMEIMSGDKGKFFQQLAEILRIQSVKHSKTYCFKCTTRLLKFRNSEYIKMIQYFDTPKQKT